MMKAYCGKVEKIMKYDVDADFTDDTLTSLLSDLEHAQQMIDLLLQNAKEENAAAQSALFDFEKAQNEIA
jgi:hypothetical protein